MATNYEAIRQDNLRRYGTDVTEYGRLFFQDTYADRTHFIFELLQNAEDALKRRGADWKGSRAVSFDLSENQLRVSHFGSPFTEKDVKGICGIGESTKEDDLTEIGRFGVGFKSVYAFTDRPEIHSGDEDFAIESYVLPQAVPGIYPMDYDETVFILPFKDESAYSDISDSLKNLDLTTLLFLQQIEQIVWVNDQGEYVGFTRSSELIDDGVRKVTISMQKTRRGTPRQHEWLVFSRPVASEEVSPATTVDIAFSLDAETGSIQPFPNLKLYTYFPTHLETHVGFLMNGPYRTTLNRENIPPHESWNKTLVSQTAELLAHSLRWLRDHDRLDVGTLRCLPLLEGHFKDGLLGPLFDKILEALSTERLLPKFGGGYISGSSAVRASTATLRDLFPASLFRSQTDGWLDDAISRDDILRYYVINELRIREIRPEPIIRSLSSSFLEGQTDEWIVRFYRFLSDQRAMQDEIKTLPIARLESGKHIRPFINEKMQVYLPTNYDTGFPTVARSIYNDFNARSFLRTLGLREPDPVDDVLANILPKYRQRSLHITNDEYRLDMERIYNAHERVTSITQADRLLTTLMTTRFVRSINANNLTDMQWSMPNEVYASDDMTELFAGVNGVRLIDTSLGHSITNYVQALMKFCGISDGLRLIEFENSRRFTASQLEDLRASDNFTRNLRVDDKDILGLNSLLTHLTEIDVKARIDRSKLLWQELCNVDHNDFYGKYRWIYRSSELSRYVRHRVRSKPSTVQRMDSRQ